MTPIDEDDDDDDLDQDGAAVARLIMALRSQGVRDPRVLAAIEKLPRSLFVSEDLSDFAYDDRSLPIDCGQTISQPFVVGYMTEALRVGDRDKVLEIGTGSGYQTAVLAQLCRRVYTIERYRTLLKAAEERLKRLEVHNVTAIVDDGMKGWPNQAPFDRILVTAAAEEMPQTLVGQLKVGGLMVLPVGPVGDVQHICRVTRTEEGHEAENLLPVRFVPLVPGRAEQL